MWLLQTKLLASVGWKQGCQPFSCPCSQNVTHCRKDISATCLFQESMPFGKSKPPLPTRSLRFLRVAAPSTSSALWLRHSHPFVAAEEKKQSHAEKQKFWSRSCRPQDLLHTIQWLCPRFGLQDIDCALSCDMWLMQTNVEIELLATVGWKRGCQPFSCRCALNVMHCQKEICWTCLSKESMLLGISKLPLTRSLRFLRATARSTSSALCLHHAHPFVAAAEKRPVSCREAEGLGTELWSPRSVLIYWLCSCNCCTLSF